MENPDETVAVCVAVRVGVAGRAFVLVGALVLLGWSVGVIVAVGVEDGIVFGWDVAVSVGVGGAEVCVAVAGGGAGELTVKLPEFRLRGIEIIPLGSAAAALLNERENEPGAAEGSTLTESVATEPFEIAVWLSPKMMILTLPLEGNDHKRDFPADEAADPITTLSTEMRLAS
ncbi:MAG: hypothetical protein MUO58_10020 [Anaerolineales bacterium]|nr:hypothetical protein [Anaerolineales bacterium]